LDLSRFEEGGTYCWLGLIFVRKEEKKRSMQLNIQMLQIDF
jgi:hypothetical protein